MNFKRYGKVKKGTHTTFSSSCKLSGENANSCHQTVRLEVCSLWICDDIVCDMKVEIFHHEKINIPIKHEKVLSSKNNKTLQA